MSSLAIENAITVVFSNLFVSQTIDLQNRQKTVVRSNYDNLEIC